MEPGTSVPQGTGEGTGQTWEGQRLGQGSPQPEGPVGGHSQQEAPYRENK